MNKSKRKGDNFERQVVNEAKSYMLEAYRFYCSRSPLEDKVDVVVAGRHLQCKKRAKGFKEIYKWLETGIDGLVISADYKEPLIVLKYKDWLKLL
ncbi:MAG: hypothetical protein QW051_04530 [Candidatus Aenigmatarchaeota archaeon]